MRSAAGFTYIEMLVALAIVALLATIAAPTVKKARQRADEQQLRTALREIRTAIDAFKRASDEGRIPRQVGESGYPRKLVDLVNGVPDARQPDGARIYFLRRLPADPLFPNMLANADSELEEASRRLPAERTWGLRTYNSPPDAPVAGNDVYDVYSLNPGIALDGSRYRNW